MLFVHDGPVGLRVDPHVASGRGVEAMNTTDFDMLITHPDRDVRLRAAMDAGSLRGASSIAQP